MNGDIVGDIEPAPRARRDKRPYNSFDAGSSFLFSPFQGCWLRRENLNGFFSGLL